MQFKISELLQSFLLMQISLEADYGKHSDVLHSRTLQYPEKQKKQSHFCSLSLTNQHAYRVNKILFLGVSQIIIHLCDFIEFNKLISS